MKTIIAAASSLLLSATAFAGEVTTTVKVSGWHCVGCGQETAQELQKVKGVKSVTPNFDKSQVVIAYDDAKAKPADLEAAIKKAGFEVTKEPAKAQ